MHDPTSLAPPAAPLDEQALAAVLGIDVPLLHALAAGALDRAELIVAHPIDGSCLVLRGTLLDYVKLARS